MLAVFFGASGIGKTTVMLELRTRLGWSFLRTVTTRPARVGEDWKISLEPSEFENWSNQGRLRFENNFFGHRYAWLRADVDACQTSSLIFMSDFGFRLREQLKELKYIGVVLVAESSAVVADRLLAAGRQERLAEVLSEYEMDYSDLSPGYSRSLGCLVVVNGKNLISEVVAAIAQFSAPPSKTP